MDEDAEGESVMDHYRLSAEAIDKDGDAGVFSVTYSERDSERSDRQEMALTLLMAADQAKVRLTGPMSVDFLAYRSPAPISAAVSR